MSSQKKEPPFNKNIAQSIDATDIDGILELAGKFLFVAPWNSTAAAMHMARCMKEEQASKFKQRIVQKNSDKLKQKPPPPHYVAIGASYSTSAMSHHLLSIHPKDYLPSVLE